MWVYASSEILEMFSDFVLVSLNSISQYILTPHLRVQLVIDHPPATEVVVEDQVPSELQASPSQGIGCGFRVGLGKV